MYILYARFRRHLREPECLALVAIVGFCPLLWRHKEFIGNDYAFLPFLFLALLAIDRAFEHSSSLRLRAAIPVALALAAAYEVRSIGVVLLPCFVAYWWLRTRRISRFAVIASLLVAALYITQGLLLKSESGYLSLF